MTLEYPALWDLPMGYPALWALPMGYPALWALPVTFLSIDSNCQDRYKRALRSASTRAPSFVSKRFIQLLQSISVVVNFSFQNWCVHTLQVKNLHRRIGPNRSIFLVIWHVV